MKIPEFSKKLVSKFVWIFLIHTVLSLATLPFEQFPAEVVDVYKAAVPVYMTVFGAYFGKAAFENGKKITVNGNSETING